jgi:hypothetical protein
MARQFNEQTNNSGLVQYCEQNIFGDTGFGQISGNLGRLQIITNYINEAYSRYINIATHSDGKWQFDDNNYGDYPFAITDLVANQQDYQFLTSMLDILSIEVQNTGGIWYTLSEIDEQDMANDHQSMTQRFIIPSQPWVFNRTSNSIFLLPAPNYNKTGGLKVKYQRPPSYFLYTDTTKVPGFAETFHEYLANYAIWKYAASKGMSIKTDFQAMVDKAEQIEIPNFYLKREKDTTKKIYSKYYSRR